MWQYITLMKRIYLIDCPGVVPPNNNDSPEDLLLRGVVRVENVEHPEQYIAAVLRKTKPQHIQRTYDVSGFATATEFLQLLARKGGRLLKGGEADLDGAAKMVVNDFIRGKIPWFTPAPAGAEGQEEEKGVEGRKGMLGEMGRVKMDREEESTTEGVDVEMEGSDDEEEDEDEDEDGDGEFAGFDEQDEEEDTGSVNEEESSSTEVARNLDRIDAAGGVPITTTTGGIVIEAG